MATVFPYGGTAGGQRGNDYDLARRSGALPRRLGSLGEDLGTLLVLVYLGRLVIYDPNNPALLGVAAVAGLVVHPWFFGWLGVTLLRTELRVQKTS